MITPLLTVFGVYGKDQATHQENYASRLLGEIMNNKPGCKNSGERSAHIRGALKEECCL